MSEKLNLFEKIQKVSIEIMNIEKDMVVGSGNYSYKAISDIQVTLAVKKAEEKYRLISIPTNVELINSEVINKTANGGKESLLFVENIKMTVKIIDLDEPDKFIEITSLGKGIDSADKGFGKASTYARKYALLNAYKIATGEDPDAEKSPEIKTETIDEKKKMVIEVCLKDEKLKNDILSHFSLGSLDDLGKKEVDVIFKQFKSKGRL